MTALKISDKLRAWLAHLAVLAMVAVPLFGHMDSIPLANFDEMRLGVNALEMNQSGDPIAITFNSRPEFWNCKPPLLIWAQALCMRLFGYNEISVRLPTAIAAALLCFLLLRYAKRRTGAWLPGFIAAGILITDGSIMGYHGTRSGDYDVPLALFLCASLFWLDDWVEDGRQRWLYMSGGALIAAVLTKGIAGFFFCPAMLAYVLLQKRGKILLRTRAFYFCVAGVLVFVLGYYLLREARQPGYLHAVMVNEIGGRYTNVIEGHDGTLWNYLNVLIDYGLGIWNILLIPGIAAAFLVRDERQRRACMMCLLAAVSLMIILTSSSTQIYWYLLPAYPLLALVCALFLWQICCLLEQYKPAESVWRKNFLPFVLLLLIGAQPYMWVYNAAVTSSVSGGEQDAKLYIKEVFDGKHELNADAYCGYQYAMTWYSKVMGLKGMHLPFIRWDSLNKGMRVMVWQGEVKDYIAKRYATAELTRKGDMQVLSISGPARPAALSPDSVKH